MEDHLREILSSYNDKRRRRAKLVPILQEIQAKFGYLPEEVMLEIATLIGIPESEVYSIATFYNQFSLTPRGKYIVKVCLGTACHIRGGPRILDAVEGKLNIKSGGTTEDNKFSLERVACVGSCGLAPVVMVGENVYGKMTTKKVKEVLERYAYDL